MFRNRFYGLLWVALGFISVISCSNYSESSNALALSEKSIRLLSLDSASFQQEEVLGQFKDTLNESEILRIAGESVINMNNGFLFSAYSDNLALLKSISKVDSSYFQVLFHQFNIANEVDSLKECARIVNSLGDSTHSGATWQWQQAFMWLRVHARTWNIAQYQKQKAILLQLLENNPVRLIERAVTYEQLGNYECNFRKSEIAFQYYKIAINTYQALGWTKRKYLCQIRFADELLYDGKQSEALKVFGQIPEVSNLWPEVHCRKLLFLSELAFKSFNREDEREKLMHLYNYALKNNRKFWATEATTRMASWYMESGNSANRDSVMYYANLTYQFATDLQDKNFMANASVDLSTAESLFGNFDRAIVHAKDNLELRKLQKHLHEEIKSYVRIAELNLKKKDIQTASLYNDSALLKLELFPEERPYLAEVYRQRVEIESLLGNFETAFKFRKKQFHWQSEGQKVIKEGYKTTQIRQLQSQLFSLSGKVSQIQESTLNYKRLGRYTLLLALFACTILILWFYNRWFTKQQQLKSFNEELENERFQLTSIRDDYQHELNQTKQNAIDLGNQIIQFLKENWRSDTLSETQKRLNLWLKALNTWFNR